MGDREQSADFSLIDFISVINWTSHRALTLIVFQFCWLGIVSFSIWTRRFRLPLALICAATAFLAEKVDPFISPESEAQTGLFAFFFLAIPMTFDLLLLTGSFLKDLFSSLVRNSRLKASLTTQRQRKKD
jgi:hypothetical protein